uniref:VOC family protein n=1 Tax=Nonomuraea pusilla TaxID=46177 RepID=UPI0006E125E9|nr:VOC family protein [Nonomuraea pusilla]
MLASFCPVICTSRLGESREFYTRLFGFKVTHEGEWCVGLGRPGSPPHELTLVDHSHPAVPDGQLFPVRAVRITLESDIGEEEFRRAVKRHGSDERASACHRDPESGGLVVMDPNGVLIDVVTPA